MLDYRISSHSLKSFLEKLLDLSLFPSLPLPLDKSQLFYSISKTNIPSLSLSLPHRWLLQHRFQLKVHWWQYLTKCLCTTIRSMGDEQSDWTLVMVHHRYQFHIHWLQTVRTMVCVFSLRIRSFPYNRKKVFAISKTTHIHAMNAILIWLFWFSFKFFIVVVVFDAFKVTNAFRFKLIRFLFDAHTSREVKSNFIKFEFSAK